MPSTPTIKTLFVMAGTRRSGRTTIASKIAKPQDTVIECFPTSMVFTRGDYDRIVVIKTTNDRPHFYMGSDLQLDVWKGKYGPYEAELAGTSEFLMTHPMNSDVNNDNGIEEEKVQEEKDDY